MTHWRRRDYGYTVIELLFGLAIGCSAVLSLYAMYKGIQLVNAAIHYLNK